MLGSDKETFFSNADLFVYPSFYPRENQPLVLIESMMFGLPIITTKWRAIPDMIVEGKNGYLVETHSPMKIADKVISLYKNRSELEKLSLRSRQEYRMNYSLKVHLQKIEDKILEIL